VARQQLIIEAEDVETAIQEGLKRLGKNQKEADISILQDASPGLFDKGDQPAKVQLSAEGIDLKEYLQTVLISILELMGIEDVSIDVSIDEDLYRANIDAGDQQRFVIGENGETLNAIQHVLQCALRRHSDEPVNLILDAGDYRRRRRERLENRAREMAEQAYENADEVELEPMIAFERKIIHEIIDNIEEVKSSSIGEDDNRRVVIRPKGQA